MSIHTLIQDRAVELHALIEQVKSGPVHLVEKLTEVTSRDQCEGLISRLSDDLRLISDLVNRSAAASELEHAIHHYLITHLHRGLTLKDLAEHLGYSSKYCSELFQAKMGISFSKYLKHLRMEKAKLLLSQQHSIAHVAESLGFSDQFAFSHSFKKALGCSPRQFRERCRLPVSA
jgi:AraC-like DNA-binding protein